MAAITRTINRVEKKRFTGDFDRGIGPSCGYDVDERDFFLIICVGCLRLLRKVVWSGFYWLVSSETDTRHGLIQPYINISLKMLPAKKITGLCKIRLYLPALISIRFTSQDMNSARYSYRARNTDMGPIQNAGSLRNYQTADTSVRHRQRIVSH